MINKESQDPTGVYIKFKGHILGFYLYSSLEFTFFSLAWVLPSERAVV